MSGDIYSRMILSYMNEHTSQITSNKHNQTTHKNHWSHWKNNQQRHTVTRRVHPFSCPEYQDKFLKIISPITQETVFSGMPTAAQQEAERRTLNASIGIRLAYELEQNGCWVDRIGVPMKLGDWGNLDQSIQTALEHGLFENGSFVQQAIDQVRFNGNEARHAPFNQPALPSGQGPIAMLLRNDDTGKSGSDIQKVIPSPTDKMHEIEVGQKSRLMMMRAHLKTM
jgi:hypothetical protein